jgi:hypothetical protein
MMVGDVLVVAASATTKIRADRANSLVRVNDYLSEPCAIKALFVFNHFGFDSFPINRERYEDDLPLEAADAGSTEGDVTNVKPDRRV